jgi:hypothetical protein
MLLLSLAFSLTIPLAALAAGASGDDLARLERAHGIAQMRGATKQGARSDTVERQRRIHERIADLKAGKSVDPREVDALLNESQPWRR